MKIEAAKLKKAIKTVKHIAGSAGSITCFGLIDESGLTVTDLERMAHIKIKSTVEDKVLIPIKESNGLLKLMSGDLELKMNWGLVVIGNAEIPVERRPEDFPDLGEVDTYTPIENWSDLWAAVLRCRNCIDETDARYVLNGLLVTPDTIVACDGLRLVAEKMVSNWVENQVIIPRVVFKDLDLLLKNYPADLIRVFIDKKSHYIWFRSDEWFYKCRLIIGRYPDYEELIPKFHDSHTIVMIDDAKSFTKLLADILAAAKQICGRGETKQVALKLQEGSAMAGLYRKGLQTPTWASFGCYSGEDEMYVVFNVEYLLDILKPLGTIPVTLRLIGESSPAVFDSKNMPGYTAVIMPIKIR